MTKDLTVYACFVEWPTQYWRNADGSLLAVTHDGMGTIAAYPDETPECPYKLVSWPFTNWTPDQTVNAMMMTFYAQFEMPTGYSNKLNLTPEDFIKAHDDGTYKSWEINDTVLFELEDSWPMTFKLIGKDIEGKTSWFGTICLPDADKRVFNTDSTIQGYSSSELKTFYENDLKAKVPQVIRDRIKSVQKYFNILVSNGYGPTAQYLSVWPLSFREANFDLASAPNVYEKEGPCYSLAYPTNDSRKIRDPYGWTREIWLRSMQSRTYAGTITTGGANSTKNLNTRLNLAFGFCIN